MIEFVSDFEGQGDRLWHFQKYSKALDKVGEQFRVKSGDHIVFGGDAIDRGPNSREILRFWIGLKETCPDQVTLLLGNRDLNKMRLLDDPPREMVNPEELDHYYRSVMFQRINAARAMEFHCQEIELEMGQALNLESRVESLREMVKPGGLLHRYWKLGKVAAVVEGNLFVHGAARRESWGYIPGFTETLTDPSNWISQLNSWAQLEIDAFSRRDFDPSTRRRGGQGLQEYERPNKYPERSHDRSLIYGRNPTDELGNLLELDFDIYEAKFLPHGIRRILSGHTPQGETPSILRSPNFEVIVADTSYSQSTSFPIIRLEGDRMSFEMELASGDFVSGETQLGKDSPLGRLDEEWGLLCGFSRQGRAAYKKAKERFRPLIRFKG